jgi:hypothetical protein
MGSRDLSIGIREEQGRNLPWLAIWREYAAGKPPKKRARAFATRAEAERFREQVLTLAAAPDTPATVAMSPTTGTVAAYLTAWLRDIIQPHKDGATYRSYEQSVRLHITPKIGDLELATVGRVKVREFYEDLFKSGVKISARKHAHSCLSSAMGQAVLDELRDFNPCLKLGKFIAHKDEHELVACTH